MVDYRALNAATVPDAHPLPLIEKEIAARAKGKPFTVLDLRHGFHQMSLRKEDRHLTAMCTPCGTVRKKQVLGRHRSRKNNLQHAYAPKFAIFQEKKRQKMVNFRPKIEFFLASEKQLKTPPPYFEGAGC